MLGESLHLTSKYLASEAKIESARSHMTTLEVENSKLKKELIAAMNDAKLAKEKLKTLTKELRVDRELTKEKDEQLAAAKERTKGIAAKAIEGLSPRKSIPYRTGRYSQYIPFRSVRWYR